MNGKVLVGKPLYVTFLMNKEQRKHLLSSMLQSNNKMYYNQKNPTYNNLMNKMN